MNSDPFEKSDDKPPDTASTNGNNNGHKWRPWHEREVPVTIKGFNTKKGISISVKSKQLAHDLHLDYPSPIWKSYPKDNKVKLIDNTTYIFTAHLPLLLKGNIRLEYNTGYPQSYSWANHSFMRNLPAYWYLFNQRKGTGVTPILKTLLNSNAIFSQTKDVPPLFPASIDENVIIPFTFGKDSFLTYHLSKSLGLHPVLIFFEDPVDEGYEGYHKKLLFKQFNQKFKEKTYFLQNPLGSLREKGDGWYGWELAITSWTLLCLPFAYYFKSGYIIFSNEKSVNTFFYDKNGYKIATEFEQSDKAVEELSLLTQALTEGEVYTTTFLQGLNDLAILGILKQNYFEKTFPYLMSCWSETEAGKDKRWCGACSKCARIFLYLVANGIDPISNCGYQDNMLELPYKPFYHIFGESLKTSGWDLFAVNTDEMALSFYLAYLRGYNYPLIKKFMRTEYAHYVHKNFIRLVEEYYSLHPEIITPPQWKKRIDKIMTKALGKIKQDIYSLVHYDSATV